MKKEGRSMTENDKGSLLGSCEMGVRDWRVGGGRDSAVAGASVG